MAATSRKSIGRPKASPAPGKTPAARENQLISLAVDLAAKQLQEGTASSQVITHFLKLGSTKESLEKEKVALENKLLIAKTEALESQKKVEELYAKAIAAIRRYGGVSEEDDNVLED